MLINGRLTSAAKTFPIINPSTGAVFQHCPAASEEQVDEACRAAKSAFPTWAARPYEERQKCFTVLAKRVEEHGDELARIITSEQGRPLKIASLEVKGALWWIYAATMAPFQFDTVVKDDKKCKLMVQKRPIGVCGLITPWNFPLALPFWKLINALLTGNTAVLKPSPTTPMTALKVAELAVDVFPPGVLNIITGPDPLGEVLVKHPLVNKISFTGSTAAGKAVLQACSSSLKRVTLECGGNDAAIVLPDVTSVDQLDVERLFLGAFSNSGQVCTAVKRLYVPERLVEPLAEAMAKIAMEKKVELAKKEGAKVHCGGEARPGDGYFFPMTILTNVSGRVVDEEQFGPVLPIIGYKDLDDAIRAANFTKYGLGSSVWTNDESLGEEIAKKLESGLVWINQHSTLRPDMPFGGVKESGIGREGIPYGFDDFLETRTIFASKL
eukprot:GEMP01058618.1.p1 GENE.GEMP01058618.1~~GEMP01058618.1.p1  ORF type:complete len:440 (+),score=75.75 GEMP01058618.1:44-1363(+)